MSNAGANICGVMSVLWSGGGAKRSSGYLELLHRNGTQIWSQHIEKGKDMRVMVWASFWGNGERSKFCIISRVFELKKYGCSA